MKNKSLGLNTITSLLLQLLTIICGFILPRLFLASYGSEINGLVNSIAQFLSLISLLELGVGAVVQTALYKPLSESNQEKINEILSSADSFFKRIGQILVIYVLVLMILFPMFIYKNGEFIYTAILVFSMSVSLFAQYYLGIVDRILLTADQRGYIQYSSQIVTLLANTICCVILIKVGCSVQIVKLVSSIVFLIRPIFLRYIVNKSYPRINRKVVYKEEPIQQKWNGISQHICAVVLDETDTIVLSVFASLLDVSVYSVYNMVVSGVKKIFMSLIVGVEAVLGDLWAKKDKQTLIDFFSWIEWLLHSGITLIFGCTASLLIPFVMVYTKGVTDVQYIRPVFSILILLAQAIHCYRLPYHIMIKASGHYKQTQISYIVSTVINVVVSVISVSLWGLVGVAIGTLIAMAYQTIWMIIYNHNCLVMEPIFVIIKQVLVNMMIFILGVYICNLIGFYDITYWGWIVHAIKVSVIWVLIALIINSIFYKNRIIRIFQICVKRVKG